METNFIKPLQIEINNEDFDSKSYTPLLMTKNLINVETLNTKTAKISQILHFLNTNEKTVDAQLTFPLPDDTTIHSYGLDINGTIIDAVPVEKDKARIVFEHEVRSKTSFSTSMVELDEGNSFKLRIYPMKKDIERIVKIEYFIEIKNLKLWIPLGVKNQEHLKEFKISFSSLSNFKDVFWMDEKLQSFKDIKVTKHLELDLDQKMNGILVEFKNENSEVYVETNIKGSFFMATVNFEKIEKERKVKKLGVVWCTSLIRLESREKDFSSLKSILTSLENVEVTLVTFNIYKTEPLIFKDYSNLLSYLSSLDYDGGCQLSYIEDIKMDTDANLLFSNGIHTFGKKLSQKAKFKVPYYIISNSTFKNQVILEHIANQSGGKIMNDSKFQIVNGSHFVSFNFNPEEVDDIYPKNQTYLESNSFTIYGQLMKSTKIKLEFNLAGEKYEKEMIIEMNDGVNTSIASILWAHQKIKDLSLYPEENKQEILSVGREFGIVTPGTSLILLEDISQFIKHNIIPPESRKDLRKEYLEIKEKEQETLAKDQEKKLDDILKLWKEKISKLNTKSEKVVKSSSVGLGAGGGRTTQTAGLSTGGGRGHGGKGLGVGGAKRHKRVLSVNDEEDEEEEDDEEDEESENGRDSSIKIQKWVSKEEYIKNIINAKDQYQEYIKERSSHFESPSFYLDVADHFIMSGNKKFGILILSSISDLKLNDPQLMRIIAYRLDQCEEYELAQLIFEDVLKLRPEEPQSFRDLALILEKQKQYKRALQLIWKVITGSWEERFKEIELTALLEMNHMILQVEDSKIYSFIDKRFIESVPLDLRIVMGWDTDETDIDLHVIEPNGDMCYYANKHTSNGGLIGRDFQEGYGPEEYCIIKGITGVYEIKIKYYANHQQSLTGGTTILCHIFTNYMKKNEERKLITVRLSKNQNDLKVAEIELK